MAATRWISSPSTPIYAGRWLHGASAPAGRVAPSIVQAGNVAGRPWEKARVVTPPWRCVRRRGAALGAAGAAI